MTKTSQDPTGANLILVAEDELDDFILLEYAYRSSGLPHKLQRADNGLEVLDYLLHRGRFTDRQIFPPPGLLLLDLKMPLMTGFEVLEWLRKTPEWSKLPVVVLSGSGLDPDRDKARALGARGFYTKTPVFKQTQEMLRALSSEWLQETVPA